MHLEEFAQGRTLLHRLDPRFKIIAAVLFSTVLALADRWPVLIGGAAVAAALAVIARLDLKLLAVRLAVVNAFIVFLWVFLPFSQPGEAVWTIGPWTATAEGVRQALFITVKSNTIVLALIALLSTTAMISLIHALHHLKAPDKLVHLAFFTLRYFQVLHTEYLRLTSAMKVRCFRPGTNRHTYRTYAYLVGMLLIRGFDRAERVRQAMLCRGFHGRFWVLHHFHRHDIDLVFIAVMTGLILILAMVQWVLPPL